MLRHRLITGPLLIALLLGLTWFDTFAVRTWEAPVGVVLVVLSGLFAAAGGVEMTRLVARADREGSAAISGIPAAAGAAAMTVAVWLVVGLKTCQSGWLIVVPLAAILVALGFRAMQRTCASSMEAAAAALLATIWAGGGLGMLMAILADAPSVHSGAWLLLMVILVTKFADIGAYAAGMTLGRHKLIPWLSPGKTWEGLAGGIVLAVAAALALFEAVIRDGQATEWVAAAPMWQVVVLGVLLTIGGLVGDLAMSMLKRSAGSKDSGSTLPGMGGVLDVLDSLLVTGPLAWVLLRIAGA